VHRKGEGEDDDGQDAGDRERKTTFVIAPKPLKPSIIACSSMSFGIVLKNPMRSQVQKGIVKVG